MCSRLKCVNTLEAREKEGRRWKSVSSCARLHGWNTAGTGSGKERAHPSDEGETFNNRTVANNKAVAHKAVSLNETTTHRNPYQVVSCTMNFFRDFASPNNPNKLSSLNDANNLNNP